MSKMLLAGNEAIARGAWEAGVAFASGYPGTPSTEILENLAGYGDVFCEWAPNEKVAFEAAAGAALSGARAMVTMKHVGMNVAADPLVTMAYIGAVGGLVAVVADDPGMYSSQTEQDSRHYARFAKVPFLEPANPEEARAFMIAAFEISETFGTPVILRTTTCVSHTRGMTSLDERRAPTVPAFQKDPSHFVLVPNYARGRRVELEGRLKRLQSAASASSMNVIDWKDRSLGIIASGVTALHCREIFPDASILKLGWSFPFPDERIAEFAQGVSRLIVIEEGDNILEEHVKSLGFQCDGKNLVPSIGELTPSRIYEIKCKLEGKDSDLPSPVPEAVTLPGRPPVFCPGCPHRGVFFALRQLDIVVVGDIGCYSLGTFKPLERMDTLICMGAGVSAAHGMQKCGDVQRRVGILGDSTFFHSGITGLLDIVYNGGNSTIIIVDNRITAMTGHQDHPGSGKTLMGKPAYAVSIEEMVRACGVKRVTVVDPYALEETVAVIRAETEADEPSVIISRAPCPLDVRKACGKPFKIEENVCKNCRACLKLGCPAIESMAKAKPVINTALCCGCGLCGQVCHFGAIKR